MTNELDALSGTIAGSVVGRLAAAPASALARAWGAATAHVSIVRVGAAWQSFSAPQRLRACGAWLLVAALTDGAFSTLDPRPISLARWTLWIAVLAIAAVAATFPQQTMTAWTEWRRRR